MCVHSCLCTFVWACAFTLQIKILGDKETINAYMSSMHGYNRISKGIRSNRYGFPGRQDDRGGLQYCPSRSPDLTLFHSHLCRHITHLANQQTVDT